MFNQNNLKYRYIVDSIELIKSKHWLYKEFRSHKIFKEFNTICVGGIRQSGKTTAMKKVFNANKDVYISPRYNITKEFLSDSYTINNGNTIFKWEESALKTIKKRNAILTMSVNHLKERLLITLKEDSIIFLDVFSVEIPDNYIHVKLVMDILNELAEEKKIDISKIILIYT